MASNLTGQVRNIAEVTTAVANGDLSKKITVDVQGRDPRAEEHHQHDGRSAVVVRRRKSPASRARSAPKASSAARPTCTASAGTWKDLTDNVNFDGRQPDRQVRNIADVTTAVANGDLSQEDHRRRQGRDPRAQEHDQHDGRSAALVRRGSDARRARGRHRRQARRPGRRARASPARGRTSPTTSTPWPATSPARCATSPRSPPPSPTATCRRRSPSTCKGEILELKNTINTMVDQLRSFAVGGHARRARGRHRRQARRPGRRAGRRRHVEGPDRQRQLHGRQPDRPGAQHRRRHDRRRQRRPVARRSPSTCKGEILELKNTINTMVDQLRSFAAEVTRVAREVGTEGKLGGQADVQGVAGTWKDLTDNVNFMAGEPDRPGAQHRRRHDRRRQRRPVEEDHRRRAGRDPRAEEHHQHDGRSAPLVRRRK